MSSTNDGKDVKNSQIFGQKAKIQYIELYKTLEACLNSETELGARTSLLCEAWRRVHSLCKHSATSTHPHLLSWLQRHTAQTILQSEWRQLSRHQDKHDALVAAIDFCRLECQEAFIRRECPHPQWEAQLQQRAAWFKKVIPDPWGNAVLKALLNPSGKAPSDEEIIEWLSAERGVFFVTRLRQLALSKKTEDIALTLATAIMERVRACAPAVTDSETVKDPEKPSSSPTFTDLLTMEAGFSVDVWELITDIEFVLLYSDRSKCIALAKQTPLKNGYQLVERLQCRHDTLSREKRLWKNAKDVSILIAQVMVARCMVVPTCVGAARSTLYGCSRSLVKLLPGDHLTGTMAALAAPAATARHLHTLAVAVDAECKNERKPFVCELFIRAITAGMNELERLKLNKEKEYEARTAERLLSAWFTSLGSLLGTSARLAYECALTAFSLHPSPTMYERIRTAPQLQPVPVHKDIHEPALETNSEFGSWATDSRSQTNFVKTSETLNLKKIHQHSNVLSTAILNEGETQGLSPELCQDLIVLLSGPRVKTLSWDMDKEILIENCRSYMERTQGGTRALTTELKYLNLDPHSFMHLPEELDEDEGDIYYGIEKGYEHLVELQEPEEIWEHVLSDPEKTESCYSTENETFVAISKGRRKGKPRRHSFSVEEEPLDPLGDLVPKTNHRSYSNERTTKEHSKERSKERKKKEDQSQDRSNSFSKSKSKKDIEKSKNPNESDSITIDMTKLQQKPKKERKKREKKEKNNLQKQNPTPTGLSRLVGKKIIKPNLLKTQQQIRKRETETDSNNQLIISDSDYDSQGKSSIASLHTEGNDPDVLFDGLFSMDDIKSPEKTKAMAIVKTNPLQSGNPSNRKILVDNEIKAAPNISKTSNQCYVISNGKDKDLTRPSSATPSLTKNVNEICQSPPGCNSNSCRNETVDDVKLGIKRLIEFRKQKSAIDLFTKTKPESELKQLAGQNTRKNKFCNKLGLDKMENEPRILPGSSKAISVPDIPKVFINKTQSQQLNNLKNEVDNYLLNQNNNVKSQSHPLNNLKNIEARHSNDQSVPKSVKPDMSTTHSNLNKFEQKLFNMFHQSESSKVTINNTPYTTPIKESRSSSKHNVTGKNVTTLDQKKLQEFFKELHRSNNAGVSKPNSRLSGVTKDTTHFPTVSTNYTAKQIKPSAREENAPNTFARLNYMHKNSKQIDNACKQNVDHITPNKTHKTSLYSPSIKDKNNDIDSLLSRVDCTVMRKPEITSLQKKINSKDCATSTGAINVSQNVTNKSIKTGERLIKANSLDLKPPMPSVLSTTQSTPTSISRPMITKCNDDKFQSLLQQNSNYVSRPQIRSEVVKKKEINNTGPSTSPISLNSQSLSQQLGEEVYNRLQGCPLKIQACQNVPGQTQNSVKTQSRSSNISKTKEVSTKNGTRQSSVVNNKESKSEIKKDIIPQDWESVLNDLLSHKTPSRSSNTQDVLVKKDKKSIPSNNLSDQSVKHLNCKTNDTVSVASGKLDKDLCNKIRTKQNKHPIQQKLSIIEETNKTLMKNNKTSLIYTNNISAVVNQPLTLKSKKHCSTKKPNQTKIVKRLAKTPILKLPYKKVFNVNGSPIYHTDPVISALPSSEYDVLGELMDDELRQEIGELSSDEERFSAPNVTSKGKVKSTSNKVHMLGSIDSACNLNIRQNSNNQTISMEGPEVQARPTITGYETLNAIKSKPNNTVFLHDEKRQTTINKAKIYNINNQAPCMPSIVQQHQGQQFLDTNNSTTNQSLIIGTTTNCSSLDCHIQQSGVNYSNQNLASDDLSQRTLINMNNENVFSAVPQQHPPVKNVVLIRPEIVYEPYTMQVHQIPNTIKPDCNLNSNTYVALNAGPTISMFGAQFASPVVNPLLIGKTVTLPITQKTSLAVNNGNNNKNTCSNPHLHAASGVNVSNTENNYFSVESHNFSKECFDALDDITMTPQLHSLNEENIRIGNLVSDIPNVTDSIEGNIFEGNALTVVPGKQTVQIPYAIGSDVTEPKQATSINCQRSNELNSTSNLLSENLQTIDDTDIFNSDTEIRFEDYFINYNPEKRKFDTVQEKLDDTIPQSIDDMDLENTSAKYGMRSDTGTISNKPQNVPDDSAPCLLNVNCLMLGDADNSCPKTDVKSGIQSNMPNLLNSESKESHPVSEYCTMVNDEMNAYHKIDGKVNDVISTNKFNETELLPKLQENYMLTSLSIQSTGDELDPIKPAECSPPVNDPGEIQSSTLYSNSYLLSGQRTTTVDSTNYNLLSLPLFEEYEELDAVLPEESISSEDEVRKEFLKAQKERMIRKKTAILNRQVHIISGVEPIPLTYDSINTIPDYIQRHNDNTGIDDFINNKKTKLLTVYTNSCSTTQDILFDKNGNSTDKSLQCNTIETDTKDSTALQSIHTDSSKENYGSNTTDCERLRSSIKEVDTTPILTQKDKPDVNNGRSKVRLKVKKTDYVQNGNKFKASKRLTNQNGRKITSNKTKVLQVTKDVTSQKLVKPVTDKTLDIEDNFRGSLISKQDSELPNNKGNVQSHITVSNKNYTYSVNDYESYNSKSGDEAIHIKRFGSVVSNIGKCTNETKQAPLVNCGISCDPKGIKNGVLISNELKTLKCNNSNVNENKEISMNTQQLQRLSACQQEVTQNVNSCEIEDTILNLPTRGKSRRETLGHNKLIDSYKDNIIIEELPKKKDDDPLKRCISVKLANGNSFKATVSGKLQIDINSLFEDPQIRSVLMSNIHKSRCILNVQQVISASGESIKTRVLSPKPKYLETINLISDDEEDRLSPESQVFNTEFGKYKIQGLNDNVFNEHQRKFSQKCFVKVQKCNIPNIYRDIVKINEIKDANMSSVTKAVNKPVLPENIKLHKDNNFTDDKNVQVIEIDDSSNDSADTNNKSVNITHPISIPSDIQLNFKELKETLLKDLCVDVVNRTIDTNITDLSVPIDIMTDLENLKGKLLKDLCDDLGKIENDKEISEIADVVSDLKGICYNTVERSCVVSTNSDVNSTEYSLKNTEHTCKIFSTIKDNLFVDPVSSTNVCALKSVPMIKPILPTFKNELTPTKKCCKLIIEKCDGLARKYQLMQSKQCFVSLERCDSLINSQTRTKCGKGKPEIDNLSEDGQKSNNSDTPFLTEIDPSNCNLQRRESFSILNELNLCDQTVKLLTTTECSINDKLMFDKTNTQYEKIDKIYENVYTCQSEWLMTKSRYHWMLKQILYSSIIPDDISTDCESDHDDNCTYFSGACIDGLESGVLPKQNILYEVPSLLQIALKSHNTADEYKSHEKKSSRTNCSLDHLKRKLCLPENTSTNSKSMKFDDNGKIKTSLVDLLGIKKTSFNLVQQEKIDNEYAYRASAGSNIGRYEDNYIANEIVACAKAKKIIKTSYNSSKRNQRKDNLVNLNESTAPIIDITTNISSNENETAPCMNFNNHSDTEVIEQSDFMLRKLIEVSVDLKENHMLSGNDTKIICDKNELSNIDMKHFTTDGNSKMITDNKTTISEGFHGIGLDASLNNLVTVSETEQCEYNILTRCMDIKVHVANNCIGSEKTGLNSAVLDIQRKEDNNTKDDQVFSENVVDTKFHSKFLRNSDPCHFLKDMLNIDSNGNTQQCKISETKEIAELNEINECFVSTYNEKENFAISKGTEGTTNMEMSSIILDPAQTRNNNNKTKDLSSTKPDLSDNYDFLLSEQSTLLSNKKRIHERIESKTENIDIVKNFEYKHKSPNMDYMQRDVYQEKSSVDEWNNIEWNIPLIDQVMSSQIVVDATSNKEGSLSLYNKSDAKSKISTAYETLDSGGINDEPQITILTGHQSSDAIDQILNIVTKNNLLEHKMNNYFVSNDTQSNNCKKPPKKHYTIQNQEIIAGNDKDTFVDEGKHIVNETHLPKNYCLSVSSENNIMTDGICDKDTDVRENIIDGTPSSKNITLLYESDSKVVLKGSIIKDPIVGTCYVFPIINTDMLRPVVNNNDDNINEEQRIIRDIRSDLFKETDLIVSKPRFTYSKRDLDFKYSSKNFTTNDKVSRRNTKRKIESVDSKITYKKYRKGKNIDHPKVTVTAVHDFCYSKEFKKLSNYCDSIKFSYTKQYHLIQLDDVHTLLKDWPIKEEKLNLSTSNVIDTECHLFVDIDQRISVTDPMEQTLAEEILAIYDEKESTSPVINETNFSMGFGEGSGRVEQNLMDGKESIQISAVTLSDVKHSQPFLQSVDNTKYYVHDLDDSKEKQRQILNKCYSHMRLRDKVQSFFRKTSAELNYTRLKDHFKSGKRKFSTYDLCDNVNFPFDLYNSDFFEAPLIENIVQVVQIGQLPVSTGAQNPITCDPRVTQVTDASPPQCSVENDEHDDIEPGIKTEYTELTTADISLPLMRDYDQHHQELTDTSNCNAPVSNDNITIETEVKIEVLEDVLENEDEQSRYDTKDYQTFSNDRSNTDYAFDENDIEVQIKTEEPDAKIIFEPVEGNVNISQIPETYEIQQHQPNLPLEKPDQLAHAMSAAGITTTPEPMSDTAMDLSNSLSRNVCTETDVNNYQTSNITAMALQHALAQILPSSVNQPGECESNPQVSVASQILHIVHGKNGSLNQLSLNDNTQQSVISTATPTPVLHIVQSKNGPTSSSSNGSPVHNSSSYGGLSLVDTGLSQGGNQLLHIVNTGNQKSNNGTQLLKRVNLLTNVTNAQGSNEQKMVQFVCKSADAKSIQLNTNQRSMVLRLHTIESPQSTTKPECQDQISSECPTKESVVPQELKSRSIYEENYAKFIQNSKQPLIEKSTSLPKFNQAFGKPVFQEDNQKSNEIETSNAHLSSENNNIESNDCQTTDNSIHLDNIRQITSPPLLLRKSSTHTTAQQSLVQQIKQAITPMNIQTMHGGVIYTRQIPVNIGGGQTINLITVPSTERLDESAQKQKTDVRSRSEIEPSIIKIVPQSPASSNSEVSTEESGVSSENSQNSQTPPMLTQMRIKLPMLSKNPQMVSAARVVRPSFFQIQRNVIGGPNQPVYQQLVLTAAPTIGQQSIRLPHAQTSREIKVGTESQTPPESQMSSSTLEQLREFDMVLEQVKERSTVQPNGNPNHDFSKSHIPSTETSDNVTRSTPSEVTQQVLYSIGNNQSVNVAYVNRKSTVVSTSATTSFARSPDSSSVVESSTSSSQAPSSHTSHTVTSESTNGTHSQINHHKVSKVPSKSKSRPKSHHPQFKINSLPPKPSNQKPMEDEQTTQRILYILAEYKEQVENSPDKDKPAPRRRTNLQASVTPPGGSKRKKSGSRRTGRDSSPLDDNCRTMGSEDSSCGTSQGDCNESCQDLHSPQGSPRKVAKKLSFDQDPPISQSRSQPQQTQPPPQSQIHKQSQPHLQRNVLVTDGPTIAVTRAAPGKPATAVLMPANYILPVSMVKSGQQIAIVTNRGPKILTVGGGEGGATNALLLQRLISPSGLKPVLARPGVRHVRLPTTALHNLQTFNLATAASAHQPVETVTSPVPATSPPELIDAKAPRSSWTSRESEVAKPEKDASLVRPEREQEPELEPEPEPEPEPDPDPDPDPEPWNVPHDYSYEETVRTEMDRTVLDAIPDRYSPDMEAQRIFDKMFDVESKKGYIDSQDDSPRCPYDIDASDCDDKAYHQVVQRRDGVTNRHRFISAATLRQKFALMEDELRLQKSLSEECEDLGVDSPSASDLFPEAELLFSSSPAHEVSLHSNTPQPVILSQSNGISKSDDDQSAAEQVISRENHRDNRQTDEIDLGLEDVGIVTVSEDGMRATISLDHEEFVRSHPNTTFHSELIDEGEVQPVTLADLKARHITSTIFHAGRAPATVLVTAPQTTVISQATPDGAGVDHVRCSHADNVHHEGVTRFDGVARFDVLKETRETANTTSAIIHSTGNATQVIRRVCYERNTRYFLDDDLMNDPKVDDRDTTLESDDRSSPERHSGLFWDNSRRRENRRLDFSSDSDKCCKSPYDDHNSTDSSMGVNMRLDSVIKNARGIDRSDSSIDETNLPPLRTYPPKRTYHHDGHRTISGRKAEGRFADGSESKRRASNRGVVKRGCQCCNGTPAPPKPKKPRHKKPTLDFN